MMINFYLLVVDFLSSKKNWWKIVDLSVLLSHESSKQITKCLNKKKNRREKIFNFKIVELVLKVNREKKNTYTHKKKKKKQRTKRSSLD